MPIYSTYRTYDAARKEWDRCRDAFGGTDAVKKKHTAYLPMLEGHDSVSTTAYQGYLQRAMFYPAMSRTVMGLAGVIFSKPPTVDGVPKSFQSYFDDVTLSNVPLVLFGLQACIEILVTGRVGILVDLPNERVPDSQPYWTMYPAENVINWRTTRIDGRQTLTLVVLEEEKEILNEKDVYAPKIVKQYRVLQLIDNRYEVEIFTQNDKSEWVSEAPTIPLRRGVPLDYIPFTFVNASDLDTDLGHPPLLDLVDVNLSHYRTSADQEHGAHFTALPTPYITGHKLKAGEVLGIGSGTAWVLEEQGAQAGMVEFTGAGLSALASIKEEKRDLMATLGARMLETQKRVQEAAQTVAMRHAGERSSLSVLSETLSRGLSQTMRWSLYWQGLEETALQKVEFKLNPDVADTLTAQDITALVTTWQAGAISHKTLYHNLEWGEWTRPGVEFDEELADIEEEAPDPNLNLPPGVVPVPGGPVPAPPKPGPPQPPPAKPKA